MEYVTVAVNATDQNGANLDNGHLHFEPSDIAWVQTGNIVAPITPVDVWAVGGVSTNGSISLFAMDNAGVSTNWSWIMSGELQGYAIPPRSLTVLSSNGANQNLADLLAASSLVAT